MKLVVLIDDSHSLQPAAVDIIFPGYTICFLVKQRTKLVFDSVHKLYLLFHLGCIFLYLSRTNQLPFTILISPHFVTTFDDIFFHFISFQLYSRKCVLLCTFSFDISATGCMGCKDMFFSSLSESRCTNEIQTQRPTFARELTSFSLPPRIGHWVFFNGTLFILVEQTDDPHQPPTTLLNSNPDGKCVVKFSGFFFDFVALYLLRHWPLPSFKKVFWLLRVWWGSVYIEYIDWYARSDLCQTNIHPTADQMRDERTRKTNV